MIKIVDTAVILNEDIIPRYEGRGLKALCDEGEVLLEGEVSVNTCGGYLSCTMKGKVCHRVWRALGIIWIVPPCAVAVLRDKCIMRSGVSCLPEL